MTNAELVILSLIVERPLHGYEIEQVLEERRMREWTEIGFSSIYYVLRKLEKAGLITGRLEPADGRGPPRKVYSPTPAGREAFHQETIRVLETPHVYRTPLYLGIANTPLLSLDEVVDALRRHRDRLVDHLADLKVRSERQTFPDHALALFDYTLTLRKTELEWMEKYIQNLEERAGGTPTHG